MFGYNRRSNITLLVVIILLFYIKSCLSLKNTVTSEKTIETAKHSNNNTSCDLVTQVTNCRPDQESRPTFPRYRYAVFLGSVFLKNCVLKSNSLKKVQMSWEIWKLIAGQEVKVKDITERTFVFIEEGSMDYGIYKLKLIANIFFEDIHTYTETRTNECYFEMIDIGTQTIIYGGHTRSINFQFNIYFEVLTMLAPHRQALSRTVKVNYLWQCINWGNQSSVNQVERFCKDFETLEPQWMIKGPLANKKLIPTDDDRKIMTAYRFSLSTELQDEAYTLRGDQPESQILQITGNPGVNIGIVCLLNCGGHQFRTNPQDIIHLEAKFNISIMIVIPAKEIMFVWLYQTDQDKELIDIPMGAMSKDTSTVTTELRLKRDFLKGNTTYCFHVQSIHDGKTLQTAEIKIFTSPIPSDVTCTINLNENTIEGIYFYDAFCTYKHLKDHASVMFEFYNKNNKSEVGRHLGFSMSGVLENVLLTRSHLYVVATNLFGAFSETQTKIDHSDQSEFSSEFLFEVDIDLVFGSQSHLLHNYIYHINLISAYCDMLSNSTTVSARFKFDRINRLLKKLNSLHISAISGAIMLNSFLSNVVSFINNTDPISLLKSESVTAIANLMITISSAVKDVTMQKTSRLISTHRIRGIVDVLLKCSNFILVSKENYNLLDSNDRNNLKVSISSMIRALKDILTSIIMQQSNAINDFSIKLENIEFEVSRMTEDEFQFTKTNKDYENILKLAPSPKLHLSFICFKINPFWWSNGYKINTHVKIIYLPTRAGKDIDKLFYSSNKKTSVELKVNNFNYVSISSTVKQPNPQDGPEINDKKIDIHKIGSEVNSLSFINFTFIQNGSSLRVVILQGRRPDFECMKSHISQEITTESSFIKFSTKDLKLANEFFYIGILPGSDVELNGIVNYNFTIFNAACRIWKYDLWTTSERCLVVSHRSSENALVCNCPLVNETVGGELFVPSHQFNPFSDFTFFISDKDYPFILTIPVIVFLLYFLLLIWTRMRDKQDKRYMNVIVLEDNVPRDSNAYLIGVFTGARIGAGTTSNVGLRLFGEEGISRSHILNSLRHPTLECNTDNWYLLCTPHHLGSLTNILLWTDYSGLRPNWYCSKIVVFDTVYNEDDFFFIESWFGITTKDIHLEVFEECATYRETNEFSRIISENLYYSLIERHYLASVIFKHPRSPVTRTQRLSVVICGLLVSVLVCTLLYYPISPQSVDFSRYIITKDTLIIGMIGSLSEYLVSFVIMRFFYSSYTLTKSPLNFRTSKDLYDMYHLKRKITLTSKEPFWLTIIQSLIKQHLKPIKALPLQSVQNVLVGIDINKKKLKTTLIVCVIIMIICVPIILICGFWYSRVKTFLLYSSILFSIIITNLILVPIKVFVTVILFSWAKIRYYDLLTFSIGLGNILHKLKQKYSKSYKRFLVKLRNLEMYKPPNELKIQKLIPKNRRFVLALAIYYAVVGTIFLCIIILLINLFNIKLHFLMNMEAFCSEFGSHKLCATVYRYDLGNIMEFQDSLPDRILPLLFYTTWYNGDNISLPQELFHDTGWEKNRVSRLIGVPRLRQIRVTPVSVSQCNVPKVMKNVTKKCQMALSTDTEDHKDYGISWRNTSSWDHDLFEVSPWKYTKPSDELGFYLRGPSGNLYHSGGYVATLHRDLLKTRASLSSLLDSKWIDDHTRVIITDFTLYNVNNNMFIVTHIVTEVLTVGTVTVLYYFKTIIFSSFTNSGVLFGITFAIFTLQFVFLMNIVGVKKFLRNIWNLCDFLVLLAFVYNTVIYCHWLIGVANSAETLSKQGKDVYFSIEDMIHISNMLKQSIVVLFFLMLFRLLRIIKFNNDVKNYTLDLLESRHEIFFACLVTAMFMFIQFRLIMFLTIEPPAYSLKDVLIFRSQFKNIVRTKYHDISGKLMAFMLNFTSQLGIFTFMLSQYHHFKVAQVKTRVQNLERKMKRAKMIIRLE